MAYLLKALCLQNIALCTSSELRTYNDAVVCSNSTSRALVAFSRSAEEFKLQVIQFNVSRTKVTLRDASRSLNICTRYVTHHVHWTFVHVT
jgi:hypothetical protein